MNRTLHLMEIALMNNGGGPIEYPACWSEKDFNSGRWTDDIDAVTCVNCLSIYDNRSE